MTEEDRLLVARDAETGHREVAMGVKPNTVMLTVKAVLHLKTFTAVCGHTQMTAHDPG